MNTVHKKILLIDDNDDSLDLLELFLYNEYDLLTAQNGFEALKVAERSQPDLVITDITMPVMDGIRFLNELRNREKCRHIPIIAFTAFAEQTTVASLLNVGFNAVLSKPFQKDGIHETIARVLAQTGEQPKSPEAAAQVPPA